MSTDNLAVGRVHELCPICGKPMNHSIILNTKLTKKDVEQIKKLDGKAIKISEDACEECLKHKDECIYVIGIDSSKGEFKSMSDIYRTGQIVGVRKDFKLLKDYPEFVLKTKNGVEFCFIEEELGKEINLF